MAITAAGGTGDKPIWNPSKFALWSQRTVDPNDANPTSVSLRHPTAPFVAVVDEIDDTTMQRLGSEYISQASQNENIDPPLGLFEKWLEALHPDPAQVNQRLAGLFGWLPIDWPLKDTSPTAHPLVSFRAVRVSSRDRTPLPDQTVILLASERLTGQCMGSEFGIRVVAHVHERPSDGKYEVRITGMSASLPFGKYLAKGLLSADWNDEQRTVFLRGLLGIDKSRIGEPLGLSNIRFRGFRLAQTEGGNWQVERHGTFVAEATAGGGRATSNSFVTVDTVSDQGDPIVGRGISFSKVPLVADATPGHAHVFPIDPASQGTRGLGKRRPTRSEKEQHLFRKEAKITAGQRNPLEYGDPVIMRVVVCPRFVLGDRGMPAHDPKTVDLPGTGPDKPPILSDDFAAVSAYKNVEQFFERLDAYGIPAEAYFRIAKLPLKVFYRSQVRPGPGKDGQTVNARVLVEGWDVDFEGPTKPGERPGLELHLALANLTQRARKPWNGKDRSPAVALSIAADARWIWHEIGHVLLMASVGELQFRFAHSPGDALAAIAADPQSKLAMDRNWRGATFPWVFLPRRHDRCVSHGWSWGGSMHHAVSQVPTARPPRRKGYRSEQILSSSLFRLYRCIGGDTTLVGSPDKDEFRRESASHYSIYLILRAIQMLGSTDVVPACEPDQFVSALMDADIGTDKWDVTFPSGSATPFDLRIGGCVHKAIRWAFEAQGLYTPPEKITNAPGAPPPVDVYIEDLRPTSDTSAPSGAIEYGPGGYNPVSLDWDRNQKQSDRPPQWQASREAIVVSSTGEISVVVKNRGTEQARNVEVSVWWLEWPTGAPTDPLPKWDTSWTQCSSSGSTVLDIDPSGEKTFGTFSAVPLPTGRRYLLLAIATCADDRANTDVATGLPCSRQATPLLDLVANDNNLGLRVLGPL